MPSIDILMATYNGEEFLMPQVESIIEQTFEDWTLIVSDDGSSDRTLELVRDCTRKDMRIRMVDEPNPQPGSSARNFSHLMRHATADYVMLCDQDDIWHPDKVERTLRRMQEIEAQTPDSPVLVFTDMTVIDENRQILSPSFESLMKIDTSKLTFPIALTQPFGAGCTMMANRRLRDLYVRTPLETPMLMHDWWLALIATGCGTMGHLDVPTSDYRQHGSNVVGATKHSVAQMMRDVRTSIHDAWKTADQARAFRSIYYQQLPAENQQILDAYCDIDDRHLMRRIQARRTSRAWKTGWERKAAEVLMTIAGRRESANEAIESQ